MRKRKCGVAHPAPAHRLQLQPVPEDFAISPPCAYLVEAAHLHVVECATAWVPAQTKRTLAPAGTPKKELEAMDAAILAACEAAEAALAAVAQAQAQEAAAAQPHGSSGHGSNGVPGDVSQHRVLSFS